ncbi:uncharacterized protein LOC115795872 [Archocentrus centrarchus]|uniref:uncharacterized protein LOC115795872 n=1 Tax=Archocentrus centrarchus TaxID=63155 RepID=UPI0011EA2A0E|nr:uncharacterized protein LOC115795872 [Archocentrus centrarchus]
MTVKPGENITLYCDCKSSVGVYVVWYRFSHENHPSLILKTWSDGKNVVSGSTDNVYRQILNPVPNFHLIKNDSSQSYDLLITNITDLDEGFYYCGTQQPKVEDKEKITREYEYRFGNITTRISFQSESSENPQDCENTQDYGVCWTLLYSLCPAFAVVSSLLSFLLIYHCKKTAMDPQSDEKKYVNRDQTRRNQDEDVCYAALEIRQASQRPKKRTAQSSDFSTYSAINTCSM